jgi:hypothetical protein
MKQVIFVALLMGALFGTTVVNAQTRTTNINRTQRNEQARIQQGVHSGSLTKAEARHLRMQQAKVRHYKTMAKADGCVTPREKRLIHKEQMVASRSIYNSKHNNRDRW